MGLRAIRPNILRNSRRESVPKGKIPWKGKQRRIQNSAMKCDKYTK